MRPEQQITIPENPHTQQQFKANNNSGKTPYANSNLMEATNINILNVVIMMRRTYASFKQFYENVDMSILWSICRRGENERGATTTTTEMVPRQHSGSGSSCRY